ncbi:MAG: apolipoprotein N-acyltransferase [Vicinamibacteria bacterium]
MNGGRHAGWTGDALAALSGVLLALSFPKFGHWLFAWVALAPLLVSLAAARSGRAAFRRGYVTGAVSSMGLVYWTEAVVVQFGGLPVVIGLVVMTLLCLALALFPSLFAWLVWRWLRRFGRAALLLAPFAWVATEILRAHTLFRFSWCLLGYSQHENVAFIQIARFGAGYLVSALVASSSAVLAYLALEKDPRARAGASATLAVVLLAVGAYGSAALTQPIRSTGRIKVGLVQAAILQGEKWDPALAWRNVERHVALTEQAADQGARLVVWPESAVPFLFDREPSVAARLRNLAQARRIHLLFGNDDREDVPGARYRMFVGAKMLDPAGALVLRYHKIRLVPFGEYVPMQPLLTVGGRFAAKLVDQVADFTPGSEHVLASIDGHPVGATICYEAIFPDVVRGFAAGGAELLVNVTNDAWYGRSSAPHQHLAMAAFRAVENGKYLVRAANTGISAVVDTRGRVVERTALFEPGVLVRDVPFVSGTTFYARHGDVFAWGCFGLAAVLTAVTLRRGRAA